MPRNKKPPAPAAGSPKIQAETKAETPRIEPTWNSPPDLVPALVLPAEITHAQAVSCLHLLLTAAHASHPDQGTFVVDAALLTRFDSSALAVLLECRRAVLGTGQPFAVRGMPERLAELARLYDVAELLDKS